jgi:hypothetical protein
MRVEPGINSSVAEQQCTSNQQANANDCMLVCQMTGQQVAVAAVHGVGRPATGESCLLCVPLSQ